MYMKDNKNIFIIVLIAIVLVVGIVVIVNKNKGSTQGKITDKKANEEILSQTMQDGTKLNTSNKLSETKKIGNIEISKAQLTNKNGKTTLLADVKNIGSATIQTMELEVTLVDSNGKEIQKLNGMLGTIKPNGTAQLNISTSSYYENVYDYTVRIK